MSEPEDASRLQPASPGFRDVRMRGFRERAELADVVALLDARVRPLLAENVGLHEASARVLAAPVMADVAVPSFDRAAMDGYAVRGDETFGAGPYNPLELDVVGISLPAQPHDGVIQTGQAVRIMTGAPLPGGADAVVPAEDCETLNNGSISRVRVTDAVPPGRHVGRRGEDIAPGSLVLPAGRVLRPQDLGVLASIGAGTVLVVRRPMVTVLITGDELLPCGSRPEGFRIVDSNSVMLEALVRRDGGLPDLAPLVPDRRAAVREALLGAQGDVVLIAGGSSVGQEDHAPQVLAEIGQVNFHGLALRPASPSGLGFMGNRPVFLLPGNPVSCLCAYDLLAGSTVRRLGGRSRELPYRIATLPLGRKIVSLAGRVDYVRVQVRDGKVEPLAISGASILSSTTRADGFVLVARDSEGHAPGEAVQVYFYD
jgi:molybdopterin molybdotransferase